MILFFLFLEPQAGIRSFSPAIAAITALQKAAQRAQNGSAESVNICLEQALNATRAGISCISHQDYPDCVAASSRAALRQRILPP